MQVASYAPNLTAEKKNDFRADRQSKRGPSEPLTLDMNEEPHITSHHIRRWEKETKAVTKKTVRATTVQSQREYLQ